MEELANDKNNRANDYYKKIKARVDKAIEPNINALLDNIIQDVSKNFLELFNESNSPKDTHILLGDRRKGEVLQRWAVYANKFVEKPSNYKEALRDRFIPSQILDKLSREQLVNYYNLYRNVAKEMYGYGSYVYGELCEELARGRTGLYNRRNREDVRGGNVTRHELEQIIAGTRIFRLNPEKIKYITALFGKQALEKMSIPKHPHEEQNSRDVSAFSFGENPLSEQALKAKAEFETPLDKLEKVSRERLHKTEQRIQDFGKRIGVPVHFVRHPDKGYRGVCIHNGGIYINLNSNVPARRIFMHEFTHWLKASGEDNHKIFTALASVIETKQDKKAIKIYKAPAYVGNTFILLHQMIHKKLKNPDSADEFVRSAPTTDDTISSPEQSSSAFIIPQNQQSVIAPYHHSNFGRVKEINIL